MINQEKVAKKTCTECPCLRDDHDIHQGPVDVRNRVGLGKGQLFDNREITSGLGYSWVPPGLDADQIEDYFSKLPRGKVPRIGTPGEEWRNRQLSIQIPQQDFSPHYNKFLGDETRKKFLNFVKIRGQKALDVGIVKAIEDENSECKICERMFQIGEIVVVAEKFKQDNCWHPNCFRCCECNELLVDLVYCVLDEKLYCQRHYAEKMMPRCASCEELIFSKDYTNALNKDWHSSHFSCEKCDDSLSGQKYVLRDDKPYCIKCYELHYANKCEDCNEIIGINSKDLSYKDRHWHEACFKCNKCKDSLVDKPFGSKADRVYCGECYDAAFASRCDGCNKPFKAGMKKMEYKGRQWHENCFVCVTCKVPIGSNSFIPKDNEIYCTGCYEDQFATRCCKCKNVINGNAVQWHNEPWHKECFTCASCDRPLSGTRFTSKEDKPYCAECFGELFAKRCFSCNKPITGIGGTRFVAFEDRNWHNDCFVCAMCNASMVGKGFITAESDILCPDCAKQKLL
ncbi:four and a half LIM domains protein limpet isoform X2 [Brevipalpus obovatus]|uniref:four and a half LIM domains protein limpet isoform X2 n=1 Tax=Brevipalpus obovatus TaxID=246614 RepID=UPI003D9E0B23